VGHYASQTVFLMPHTTLGLQQGAVNCRRAAAVSPRHDHSDEVSPDTTNLRWQRVRDGFQATLEGAP
jgi:hypothetical protein